MYSHFLPKLLFSGQTSPRSLTISHSVKEPSSLPVLQLYHNSWLFLRFLMSRGKHVTWSEQSITGLSLPPLLTLPMLFEKWGLFWQPGNIEAT